MASSFDLGSLPGRMPTTLKEGDSRRITSVVRFSDKSPRGNLKTKRFVRLSAWLEFASATVKVEFNDLLSAPSSWSDRFPKIAVANRFETKAIGIPASPALS